MRKPSRRAAICFAVLLTVALPALATATTPRTNLPDVEDEVMCTICGTLLAESESPQAESERDLIRKLIAKGRTKDQIEDALVAQYGPNVLATPSGHGFDLLAWLVPGAAIALAAIALGLMARRRFAEARSQAAPAELDRSDAARLEEDLSRYEL